jgi:hypothetical protein
MIQRWTERVVAPIWAAASLGLKSFVIRGAIVANEGAARNPRAAT